MQTAHITSNLFTHENKIWLIIRYETITTKSTSQRMDVDRWKWWQSILSVHFFHTTTFRVKRIKVYSYYSHCQRFLLHLRELHLLLILCLSCAVPRVCVAVVKCVPLLSVYCCKNKQDLRGFQHCADQLKQSSPIRAGKAQCHAALSKTRLAAAEIQPCKSLPAERWSWYRNLLKERNLWLISQSHTSSEQGRHKGISEREKETWQPCVGGLEFTDTAAALGKAYLLCFLFSMRDENLLQLLRYAKTPVEGFMEAKR